MIEKRNPDQKADAEELFDDEPIIDLTDEVVIAPQADREPESSKTEAAIRPEVDNDSQSAGDDMIIFTPSPNPSSPADPHTGRSRQGTGDDISIGLRGKLDSEPFDDNDLLFMDEGPDEVDDDLSAIIGDGAVDLTGHGIRNHIHEIADREHALNEEEIEFFFERRRDDKADKLPASDTGHPSSISVQQIDRAVERIIKEKLAGRIEHIIYEVIEKVVQKEIDRLKESLLDDTPPR